MKGGVIILSYCGRRKGGSDGGGYYPGGVGGGYYPGGSNKKHHPDNWHPTGWYPFPPSGWGAAFISGKRDFARKQV
jgi:hypothetical protein